MDISKAINAKCAGRIKLHETHTQKLIFVPDDNISKQELKDNRGRVYFIAVNKEIQKIGGSQAAGGIQATIAPYLGGFAKGMSPRTYCVWNYMFKKCQENCVVEFYFILAPMVEIMIPSMYDNKMTHIATDYHAIETECIREYILEENTHPYLNIQESGRKWIDTGLLEGYPGIIDTGE